MDSGSMPAENPLIEVTGVDRRFYTERLTDFLPDDIVDIHAHVWRTPSALSTGEGSPQRTVTWPARVADENPMEHLLETYRLLLPGRRVTPLVFANLPEAGGDLDEQNGYIAECSEQADVPALLFSHPSWTASELEDRALARGFLGAKSYLSLSPAHLNASEIRIFDFFPRHQLAVHNRHGWLVMLHLPRSGRLKDPVNLAGLLEIERDYPDLNLIVAHVGRAYCDGDVGNAFDVLGDTERMCFDISANTNAHVFEQLLRCVGPQRVLFGSDLPITRMRMRRIECNGHYVNLVPRGLYGDVSGDPNMAEVDGAESERLTFFLYEELDAFRRAAERVGLSPADGQDVFHNNARRLLDAAGFGRR